MPLLAANSRKRPCRRSSDRQDVVVQLDLVARPVEHREGFLGHGVRVARLARVPAQGLAPEPREVVAHRGVLEGDAGAQVAHRVERVQLEHARVALGEKLAHRVLRAHDHRPHFPQGVVEIEDDRLDFAHVIAESSGAAPPRAAWKARRMTFTTRFARRFVRPTGALELMQDLAGAAPGTHMLGGGNPARIPAVEAVYARRLAEIAADPAQFGRFAASYAAPGGDAGFRATVAEALAARYGWPLTARNVALTGGSQSAFFTLFNLLAGATDGGPSRRILLPLAPEYIGYTDVGLTDGMIVSRRAAIEELPEGFFKYRLRFEGLESVPDVAAICVSRPTNPSGNVLTLEELVRLDDLARRRGVPLIVDAAYGLPFPGIQFAEEGAALERQRRAVHESLEARNARHADGYRHRRRARR